MARTTPVAVEAREQVVLATDRLFQDTLSFLEDPIEGTTETVTTGFYIRDGVKALVTTAPVRPNAAATVEC